ncbi:DUF1836 domain-containing protein [Clostridium algidicarnis]|uniref:Uncharacterized protein DUF1836 n=2 Tax=Clostridium algidicarnis TaxID=37659 RepID=A0A2S6FX44_9CLOT|nr:DUF1836 domain-containing protein [Clostridium algidicarnis]MBB6630594.1 DUF1836 domain-containing protein [Clostridium algidicarnis]MBB6697425.1 DUF1836 domain-containing protein [Clostridium algidicarnis]MBU3194990.1 DUF1836 domain-containing protein [Clostridium algidicarnis]MBU3202695.1 DUF1836 domain-containing protein [Clostridium algidicarnis]MBU3206837.1 DUF1836 domain-containing protein [Clostridium algidicarnis]
MDKESLDKLLNSMNFEEEVKFQDIPSIDLYMDQVISIFENSLKGYKRNEKDKILTKTMINNYVKDKLLMGVKNKKYSREHIILLILIYNLKQSLAIGDIKKTLTPLIEKLEDKKESIPIKDFYDIFLNIKKEETLLVNEDLYKKLEIISSNIVKSNFEEKDRDYLTSLFMIISLINTSNMYKKLAEKFIDDNIKGMDEK